MTKATIEFKLFPDLLAAISKVITEIKALSEIPKNDRTSYYDTMDKTYRLLDSTLIMVMNRLDDAQDIQQDDEFLIEVTRLGNYDEWYRAERELRLCRRLRIVRNDTERIRYKLIGKIVVEEWDEFLKQMQDVLTNEDELAEFLTNKFWELSDLAKRSLRNDDSIEAVRQRVEEFHNTVNAERRRLMRQDVELYEII